MKKEPLSIMIVKTLLAVVIFAEMWIIIIGGAWLVEKHGKVFNNEPVRIVNCNSDGDCKTLECPHRHELGCTSVQRVAKRCINNKCVCRCKTEYLYKAEEVTIVTDKTEYEQRENIKATVKNDLNNPIKHLRGVGCGLQGFSNREWINASSKSCKWDGEDKLKPNSEYNFNWTTSRLGLEKYRIAFYYQEQKLIETKEIGKIICEEKLPDELEKSLLNGKWVKGDNKGCNMCDACFVCSCTIKNAWAINGTVIDVHLVSCSGNGYTIKYKGEEYNCISENYKLLHEQASLYPKVPEGWETIYSNEFTIKEKSVLDPRCSEKVKDISGVNDIDCAVILFGYEYDSVTEKCVMKAVDGCSFETPFNSLEECREVCKKDGNIILPDEDELIKCGNDNDCALVNSGCCGCSMGGGVTCINKKYLGDWNQKLRLDCEGSIACPAVYLCDTNPTGCECVNNICRGTGGDLTKL